MTKKTRILLLSFSTILLSVCIITGGTYALFSDSVSVTNHLRAGTLDVSLYRTNLDYAALNESGYLEQFSNTNRVDFSGITNENIFGLTDSIKVVPGSWFEATMELKNDGNVAFDYTLQIKLGETSDEELAKQLFVTITDNAGKKTEMLLDELNGKAPINMGEMAGNADSQNFTVKITFSDDADSGTSGIDNDDAQAQTVSLDLIVAATQAT